MSLVRKSTFLCAFICVVYTGLFVLIHHDLDREPQNYATPLITWERTADEIVVKNTQIHTEPPIESKISRNHGLDLLQSTRTPEISKNLNKPSDQERQTIETEPPIGSKIPSTHGLLLRSTRTPEISRNLKQPSIQQRQRTIEQEYSKIHSVLLRKLKENGQPQHTKLTPTINNLTTSTKQPTPHQTTVTFHKLTSNVYIYAGFFDRRGHQQQLPVVKLLALTSSLKDDSSLVCLINATVTATTNSDNSNNDDNSNKSNNNNSVTRAPRPDLLPHTVLRIPAVAYEMCENHDKKYGGWIYSCAVPIEVHTTHLQHVSVSLQHTGSGVTLGTLENIPLGEIPHVKLQKTFQAKKRHKDSLSVDAPLVSVTRPTEQNNPLLSQNPHPVSTDLQNNQRHNDDLASFPTTKAFVGREPQPPSPFKIGVCVPPIYGDVHLQRIVNFVELSRILGANQIFLYIHDVSQEMVNLLQEYSNMSNSILSLVFWNIPLLDKGVVGPGRDGQRSTSSSDSSYNTIPPSQIIWNRGQIMAIQHCLYANMPSFDWLLFIDIDEMLVPKTSSSWQDLIMSTTKPPPMTSMQNNSINNDKSQNIAALSFESALFSTDSENQARYSIDYFQKVRRSRDTDKTRRKVFVRPDKIYELGIHHVSKVITETDKVKNVPQNEALIHHYRTGTDSTSDFLESGTDTVYDATALRFRSRLLRAAKSIMKYLWDVMASKQS